jgi:hypothetical protein
MSKDRPPRLFGPENGMFGKPAANRVDITGQQFSWLTAVAFDHFDGRDCWWRFRCVCGAERPIRRTAVIDYSTKSCGCMAVSTQAERMRVDRELRARAVE